MRNKHDIVKILGIVCVVLGALFCQVAQAADESAALPQKRAIIADWQKYFGALHTLDYQWKMQGNFFHEPNVQHTFQHQFLLHDKNFRLDMRMDGQNGVETKRRSFDGKFYRDLQITPGGESIFRLQAQSNDQVTPYGTLLPLLDIFAFAFQENDAFAIETLQKAEIWQRLEKRIERIERGIWQGRHGYWLCVVGDAKFQAQTKVFVADSNRFPLFITGTSHVAFTDKSGQPGSRNTAYDSQVMQTLPWRAGTMDFVFPLQIVTRAWTKVFRGNSTKRATTRTIETTTAPVVINRPLAAARFKIEILDGTTVTYTPHPVSAPGDIYPFRYDARGGSLWAQEQRERQRVARRKRELAAMPDIYDAKADAKIQIAQALNEARTENKRVLLQFGANWCLPCHELHNLLQNNAITLAILQRSFVVVHVDLSDEHNSAVAEKYAAAQQNGIPFLIVLDSNGQRLAAPATQSLGTSTRDDAPFDAQKIIAFLRQWAPQ